MPRNIYLPFALLLLLVFVVAGCEGIEKAPGEHTLKLTKPTHSDQLVFDDENIQAKLLARKVIDGDMKELVKNAREAMGNSYSPYSRFAVGAAVRTSSGKVFQGCNIENCSYGLTICAERVAVFNAVSEGECDFAALAIFTEAKDLTPPCGACRQVLSEFCGELVIILANPGGEKILKLSELLPLPFNKRSL